VKLGVAGAVCDDQHPCNEDYGFLCVDGLCEFHCLDNGDCPENNYCDTYADVPTCVAMNLSECYAAEMCPDTMFCEFPGDQCEFHVSATTCTPDAECAWNQATCTTTTECESNTAEAACTADTAHQCAWQTSYECKEPAWDGCGDATDQTACEAVAGCGWFVYGTSPDPVCRPLCWQYEDSTAADAGQANCVAAGCAWDDVRDYCESPCPSTDFQNETNCNAAPAQFACTWDVKATGCVTTSILDCTQLDETACAAEALCEVDEPGTCTTSCSQYASSSTCGANPACAWDSYYDECAVAAGACAAKIAAGGLSTADENCIGQKSVSVEGEELYVCTVFPSADQDGCVANETVKAMINMVFLFGGVLILRRRRMS